MAPKFKTSPRFAAFKAEMRAQGRQVLCDWQAINDGGRAVEGYTVQPDNLQFIVIHLVDREDHGFMLHGVRLSSADIIKQMKNE